MNDKLQKTRSLDEESKAMVFEGMNVSQLGKAFGMERRDINEKLHGIEPTGIRNGFPIWSLRVAAPHLVRPAYDIETYLKKMNHADLPKMLTKEFWNGQRARQEYEIKAGDLWSSSEIVKKVSDVYKIMAMSLKLMSDSVERQTELTDKQRRIIMLMVDATSKDLRKKIVEHFGKIENSVEPVPQIEAEDEDDQSL